jgi:hypothetical protein
MSQIRDNVGAPGSNLPPAPTPEADAALQPNPIEQQAIRRHEKAEKEFHDREVAFQADFNKKLTDPPGFGSNETETSKGLKQAMAANGLPVPTAQSVQTVQAAVGQTPAFSDAVGQVKTVLQGDSPVPSPQQLNQMFTQVLAQAPTLAKASVGASAGGTPSTPATPGAAPATQSLVAEGPGTDGTVTNGAATIGAANNGTATGDSYLSNMLATGTNMSALVFLVTLEAQKENNKEKNDVLRQIKMYNGMLDALNTMVNDNLITAQKEIEDKKNAGKDKKNFKPEDIQVAVNWPTDLNTKSAFMNADTGGVVLDAQWGNASSSSRQLVGSQGLQNLISTADQWRTSIQNNQQQQSNRFQAKDNLVSSLWNILNAVLKNTHDGTTGTVHNI